MNYQPYQSYFLIIIILFFFIDEGSDAAGGQSLPSEGFKQEATVVVPLAPVPELGPRQSPAGHHLPDCAVP